MIKGFYKCMMYSNPYVFTTYVPNQVVEYQHQHGDDYC